MLAKIPAMSDAGRQLNVVVCGAPPAADVATLIRLATGRGWAVRVIPTPDAQSFVDTAEIEALTGNKVEVGYRSPQDERPPRPDAVIVAPASFNTVNKAALGITDTHALGVIAEAIGRGIPVVMVPWVNPPLAVRAPFRRSLELLRDEGVHVLLRADEDTSRPQPLGTGRPDAPLPWQRALEAAAEPASRAER